MILLILLFFFNQQEDTIKILNTGYNYDGLSFSFVENETDTLALDFISVEEFNDMYFNNNVRYIHEYDLTIMGDEGEPIYIVPVLEPNMNFSWISDIPDSKVYYFITHDLEHAVITDREYLDEYLRDLSNRYHYCSWSDMMYE